MWSGHGLVACSVSPYLLMDPLFEKVYMEKVILISTYNIVSIDQEFTDDPGCKEESQGLGCMHYEDTAAKEAHSVSRHVVW